MARLLDAQPDFEVVGEAADGAEGVQMATALRPDVVLMDLKMPVCNGLEATRQIKQDLPEVRVVMLTVSQDDQDFIAAVRSGVDGYLVKDMRPERLFRELRGLARGEVPLSRSMAGTLLRQLAHGSRMTFPSTATLDVLSNREKEVLILLAEGLSNGEIGEELGIALNTVRNHVHSILEKLGARNRVEAAVYAVRAGLLSPGGPDSNPET